MTKYIFTLIFLVTTSGVSIATPNIVGKNQRIKKPINNIIKTSQNKTPPPSKIIPDNSQKIKRNSWGTGGKGKQQNRVQSPRSSMKL